jgi:hypothetical protein
MHTWAAATHYLSTGAALGHDPNPWFDTDWYVQTYRDVAEAKINPLLHYVHFGGREGRRPSAEFDPHWYLRRNIDVALAGSPPLKHFLQFGAKEGRSPNSRAEREGGRSNARLSQLHMRILPTDGEIVETSEFVLSSVAKAAEQYRWRKRELPFASAWSEHPEITATGHVKADFPPPPYIVEMRNVALLGGARHIISRDNTLLHDELACFSHDQTVAIKRATDRPGTNGRIIVEFKRSAGNIVARGLHAMHEYGNNYFHFMTEVAPRVIAGRADASSRDLPLLVNGDLHQNFREVLDIVDEARPRLDLTVDKLYAGKEISFISDISSIQDVYVRPRNPLESKKYLRPAVSNWSYLTACPSPRKCASSEKLRW